MPEVREDSQVRGVDVMKNNYTKSKKEMETFVSLCDTVLQSGLLDGEKKYLVEAVMFLQKKH